MTKTSEIETLNRTDNPQSLGYSRLADDGRNSYWVRTRGAVTMRLNRYQGWPDEDDGDLAVWSDDVDGWENPS